MSIQMVCSNGHNLKIKDHWAGKSGRCPKCGVRMDVPKATPISDLDVLAMIGEYQPSQSGSLLIEDGLEDQGCDDEHNVLDDYDNEMSKATSGLSLLGSSVVKHKKKCRQCGKRSNLWFASCEFCGSFFEES